MDFIKELKQKFKICLNEQQAPAVMHKSGPAIILAVPGAGKTTTLICRTANLIINHGINPNNILSITFSKASANDMKHRFIKMFGNITGDNIHFSTIHSFAFSVIRHYYNIKRTHIPAIIEGEDSPISKVALLKSIYLECNREYISDDRLEELSNVIGYLKNMLIDIDSIDEKKFEIPNLKEMAKKYENAKKQHNCMDYDDMLVYAFDILKQDKNILGMIRDRYKYVQVDEGQDTSKIQHEIIKIISAPSNNLFMVADDDQSIYGFRGAYPKFLLEFNQTYPKASVYYMEENYRSSKSIVNVANEFIKLNTQRYSKNLFTNNEEGNKFNILSFQNEKEQFDYIISQIRNSAKFSDIAILFRNNISSIALVDILDRNNLSFYVREKKLHFFSHWITQDIVSFMTLGLNPRDIESFEKIYYKMNLYISKDMLNYIKKNSDVYRKPVFDILTSHSAVNSRQRENILRVKYFIEQIPKNEPLKAIEIIEQYANYREYIEQSAVKNGCSPETAKNILSSLKSIASNTKSIVEFITRLDELKTIIEAGTKNRGNAVTLTTIHSAKGLEFEEVFMLDLIDEQFPTYSSIESYVKGKIEEIEEERRLFYVGITRGKRQVNLITLGSKNDERVEVSRFVKEIDLILTGKEVAETAKMFKKRDMVLHKHFGRGKIINIIDDMMEIVFDGTEKKTLSLDLCVRNKVIWLADEKTGTV